ncbi:MAG: xylulokinase [Verrucomicrobiota bacterium JB022]|nr:xylulokinase [Verrucomicrobiota bacterium JB022]
MPYLLGLDVGTSSTKAVLIDASGNVVATCAPAYPFQTPKPLWAETDPQLWWDAAIKAIRQMVDKVGADEIAGIGLTGQMHGLVLLDAQGKVLRPCIMWNDQRTARQCQELTDKVGAAQVLEITGNPILPGFTAPKISWVAQHEPEVFAKIAKILLPKDYLRYKLTGEYFGEVSDASGTSLLNVAQRRWSNSMIEAVGIKREWLPELTESPVASTRISAEAAKLTGLKQGTPVIAGGGDQAAGAIGCGIIREGIFSATLGTSGVLFAHSDAYRVEPEGRLHAFCHAVPGAWHLMGVMLSAAGSYQWWHDTLGGTDFNTLNAGAEQVPAGSEGLFYLPYLSGERCPHPNPNARGAFVGLSLRHGKGHLTRAVLEGVTYGMTDMLALMRQLGLSSDRIIAAGGGANSPLWLQMLADQYATPVVTVNAKEGAAYGAALLASVGAGIFPDVPTAVNAAIKETGRTDPGADAEVYARLHPLYQQLYPSLKGHFDRMAELS